MSSRENNPYESPRSQAVEITELPSQVVTRFRWRFLPAAVFCMTGGASVLFGIFAVVVMVNVLFFQNKWTKLVEMCAGCTLYLGVGVCWLIAGCLYWNRRYTWGIIATFIGTVFPILTRSSYFVCSTITGPSCRRRFFPLGTAESKRSSNRL